MNKYGIKTQGLSTVALFAFVLFAAGLSVAEGTTTYRCPAITDAGLDQRDNGTSFGGDKMLKLAGDPAGAEVVRSIIRFSVPSFVGAAQVQSAILHLYAVEPGSVTVDVYALEKYFYEWGVDFSRNIYMGATWLIPGGKGSAPAGWDTAGGDYDIGVSASGSVGDGWSSIDVTGLVTGNFDKVRWYGMLLKLDDETADDFQSVYSRQEEESEDLAPYL
ncbi:MAG: DNRLRE domain-containing protein, partial [Deltaproteobacteria bacterium]|nr:DNRLRE domain-containing protein [Deltaproteobacteria bacterium]